MSEPMDSKYAGTGYLALPAGGAGPGILVLHAWWGLTDHVRGVCDRLAGEGYVALAPDLFEGRIATEVAEAEKGLKEADANELAHLTRSSLAAPIIRTVRSLHPYENPALVVLDVAGGALPFLEWILSQTAAPKAGQP